MMTQGLILPLFIVFFRRNIITNLESFRPYFLVLNGTAVTILIMPCMGLPQRNTATGGKNIANMYLMSFPF